METALEIAAGYGLFGLVALGAFVGFAWLVAHVMASPGTPVSVLWGLVSYQKKHGTRRRKSPAPIEITHQETGTLWRVKVDPKHWVEADLSGYGPTALDDIVVGPYHDQCKQALSYDDGPHSMRTWRVFRRCPLCDEQVLPEGAPDERDTLKRFVLMEIQRTHLAGGKVRSGMVI